MSSDGDDLKQHLLDLEKKYQDKLKELSKEKEQLDRLREAFKSLKQPS